MFLFIAPDLRRDATADHAYLFEHQAPPRKKHDDRIFSSFSINQISFCRLQVVYWATVLSEEKNANTCHYCKRKDECTVFTTCHALCIRFNKCSRLYDSWHRYGVNQQSSITMAIQHAVSSFRSFICNPLDYPIGSLVVLIIAASPLALCVVVYTFHGTTEIKSSQKQL